MYRLRPRMLPAVLTVLSVVGWNILAESLELATLWIVPYFSLILLFAWVRFYFHIDSDVLKYRIEWFGKPLLKVDVAPEEIKKLSFKRASWKNKAAVVKRKRGLPIRLVVLEDEAGYDRLIAFGEEHGIPIRKSRDYKILEKWY
ncbi:hypothetical protein [Halobacillus salinus]|uniref:Uncharacterized protein n=1 Tax=Halobacillus salinus TaxID=192814 RepID=A0A4Z0H203_9BACI|nr:hypothetical protein [Halobacillus salinus]TGB03431.1 hypothetical protein E4663_00035 [Halobacillus salinus]